MILLICQDFRYRCCQRTLRRLPCPAPKSMYVLKIRALPVVQALRNGYVPDKLSPSTGNDCQPP